MPHALVNPAAALASIEWRPRSHTHAHTRLLPAQASLWALASVATALSCYLCWQLFAAVGYIDNVRPPESQCRMGVAVQMQCMSEAWHWWYSHAHNALTKPRPSLILPAPPPYHVPQATLKQRYQACLAGFATFSGASVSGWVHGRQGRVGGTGWGGWRCGALRPTAASLPSSRPASQFLLIVLGDALYRERHVAGADGFISFRRSAGRVCGVCPSQQPACPCPCSQQLLLGSSCALFMGPAVASAADERAMRASPTLPHSASCRPADWSAEEKAAPAPKQPLRPSEWAFLASAAIAVAGTCIGTPTLLCQHCSRLSMAALAPCAVAGCGCAQPIQHCAPPAIPALFPSQRWAGSRACRRYARKEERKAISW